MKKSRGGAAVEWRELSPSMSVKRWRPEKKSSRGGGGARGGGAAAESINNQPLIKPQSPVEYQH